jgi:hypothetical protein
MYTLYIRLTKGRIVRDADPASVIKHYLSEGVIRNYLDLRHWDLDRMGNEPMRILSLEMLDASGNRRSRFAYGDDIQFRFRVQGRSGDRCIAVVSVRDPCGHVILYFNSSENAVAITLPDAISTITVTMRNNILNDSNYL